MPETNTVEEYVVGLMKAAKLDLLPEDFQNNYRDRLTDQVYRRLGILALQELNKQDFEEFSQLLKTDKAGAMSAEPIALEQFLRSHIADFETKLKHGLEQLTQEFLTTFTKA